MASDQPFQSGERVRADAFGEGTVIVDSGNTVVVRFAHGIEECAKSDLRHLGSFEAALARDEWDVPLEVINRVQAEAIESVNNAWGVFSRSRMELLPHQLWVCRTVNAEWPTRWLVADDVGLGKTIEAGMILWPLLARGLVRRLLILCPKSLVVQWQNRLRTMFDIRVSQYFSEADTAKSDFWGTHDRVVASYQTLRQDRNGRHDRLFAAQPWDLVLVDEAHHLNANEETGPTDGYRLVRQLAVERKLATSMVFFTGTPHRGKDYNFLSLLSLLRPDLFDPKRTLEEQITALPRVMIRNNKSSVTNLLGEHLFEPPIVTSETYEYSPEEDRFYDLLTQFIASGRAYASGLSETQGQAVVLVLIAMQKLASSSVAAIREAIRGRLRRILNNQRQLEDLKREYESLSSAASDDELARLDEEIVAASASLPLAENERSALEELLDAANLVRDETKTEKILGVVESKFEGRQVLFFTEYKATQALLVAALSDRFGNGTATFINGDDRLVFADSDRAPDTTRRDTAEEDFKSGRVRFLVSTEAGGEGIDLQERCFTLIHVDLPWNPMRLHQRVGRLNRYGQTKRVEVLTLRNPDTVESLIWERLNEKLDRIGRALGEVMDEPEDLLQLVLGMTSPRMFDRLFSEGQTLPRDAVGRWFDAESRTFGGRDVVEAVKSLVGNVSKFDFRQVSPHIPRVDLPDLRPFFEIALQLNGRRLREEDGRLSFLTPDLWKNDYTIGDAYEEMVFERRRGSEVAWDRLLGVGHRLVDNAIKQSKERGAIVAVAPADTLAGIHVVFRIRDRVTADASSMRHLVVAVVLGRESRETAVIRDWELLRLLNTLPHRRGGFSRQSHRPVDLEEIGRFLTEARGVLESKLTELDHGFRFPLIEPSAVLWPSG